MKIEIDSCFIDTFILRMMINFISISLELEKFEKQYLRRIVEIHYNLYALNNCKDHEHIDDAKSNEKEDRKNKITKLYDFHYHCKKNFKPSAFNPFVAL